MPTLKERPLRIDVDTPKTVFRYYQQVPCGIGNLFRCKKEVIEYDFDLSLRSDRLKFNQIGFECSVPVRP